MFFVCFVSRISTSSNDSTDSVNPPSSTPHDLQPFELSVISTVSTDSVELLADHTAKQCSLTHATHEGLPSSPKTEPQQNEKAKYFLRFKPSMFQGVIVEWVGVDA